MTPSNTQPNQKRWAIWLPLLAASAYLVYGGANESTSDADQVVRPTARKTLPPQVVNSGGESDASQSPSAPLLSRQELYPEGSKRQHGKDLFASTDWSPPPPPVAAALAPPPPMAPAFPFAFLGKRKTGSTWEVFLSKGDTTFIVHEGQTFADSYRVETIHPPQMTLTYLPLTQTQTLAVGEAR